MRTKPWTITAICLATFMLLLDITIVQVALPSIGRQLHSGLSGLQWTVDAYTLPLSALVVSIGTVSDRWGRRRIFLAGVVGFTIASALCGAAPSLAVLVAARALQGVAGAAMFATTLALIGQEFAGPARGQAIAAWGATVGAAVASGPVVGGLLVNALDWRWIFFVNVPIGVAVVVLSLRHLAEGRDRARPLDWPGLATLTAGLTLLTAGLLRGTATDWTGASGPAMCVAGVAFLATYAGLQRRPGAMLDRELVSNPAFVGVSVSVLALGAGMFATLLYLTIFLQNVLGLSALQAGVRMLPFTAPIFLVPFIARRLRVPVVSGRVIGTGMTLVSLGLVAMTAATATTSWTRLVVGMLVGGIGVGVANPSIAATALAVVPPARSGLAAGVSNTCRLGGIAIGVAVLGAVLHAAVSADLPGGGHAAVALVSGGRLAAGAALVGGPHASGVAATAFTHGLHMVLIAGAAITGFGALSAFALVRTQRRAVAPAPVTAPAPATVAG